MTSIDDEIRTKRDANVAAMSDMNFALDALETALVACERARQHLEQARATYKSTRQAWGNTHAEMIAVMETKAARETQS